jgi:phosphohistidine phosphatase
MRHELFLVRHAIAAERGPEWPDDAARPLTPKGIRRFSEAVEGLARFGLELDEVFTSPLVRASHTARVLAEGLPQPPAVHVLDVLAPGHPPEAVLEQVHAVATAVRIAIVGHEPDLGRLAAHLLGASYAPEFRKGAICRIDVDRVDPGVRGTLVWFAPPGMLRRMAG